MKSWPRFRTRRDARMPVTLVEADSLEKLEKAADRVVKKIEETDNIVTAVSLTSTPKGYALAIVFAEAVEDDEEIFDEDDIDERN